MAFNRGESWKMQKDPQTLRVMTWNAEGFINPLPPSNPAAEPRMQMLKTICAFQPDILCVQEYRNIENAKWAVPVKNEIVSLGYKYFYSSEDSVFHWRKTIHTFGVAIFSKIPLTGSRRITISTDTRTEKLAYADIIFNDKPVRIFTAHLVSFYLYGDTTQESKNGDDIYKITYKRKRSIQSKIRETEVQHEKEVQIIRKVLAESTHPVIYCGDLNTTPASYNYRILRDGLQDAFLEKGSGIGGTFYKLAPTLRIDVCLADKSFSVVQSKVIQRELSDHYPVITDLQWKR